MNFLRTIVYNLQTVFSVIRCSMITPFVFVLIFASIGLKKPHYNVTSRFHFATNKNKIEDPEVRELERGKVPQSKPKLGREDDVVSSRRSLPSGGRLFFLFEDTRVYSRFSQVHERL